MKKIILTLLITLILIVIAINIPFTEKPSITLEDNVLLFYSKGLGIAGGVDIQILNNGSVGRVKTYINKPWEFKEIGKLNQDELNELKTAINNNGFTIRKTSLLERYRIRNPFCFDCDMSTGLLINKNGEVINVAKSDVIWGIISKINLV